MVRVVTAAYTIFWSSAASKLCLYHVLSWQRSGGTWHGPPSTPSCYIGCYSCYQYSMFRTGFQPLPNTGDPSASPKQVFPSFPLLPLWISSPFDNVTLLCLPFFSMSSNSGPWCMVFLSPLNGWIPTIVSLLSIDWGWRDLPLPIPASSRAGKPCGPFFRVSCACKK